MVDPDIHLHCSSPFPKLPTVYPTSSSRKQRHLPPSAKSLVFRSFRNGTSDPFIEVQVPNQSTKIGCWTTPIQPPLPTFKKKKLVVRPAKLTFWSPKMEVDGRCFSFSIGWFLGSMLIFRGVSLCWFLWKASTLGSSEQKLPTNKSTIREVHVKEPFNHKNRGGH